MTDLTSLPLCFRHIFMLTSFLVCLLLFSGAYGAPVTDLSLTEMINQQKCGFPPANVTIPQKCSKWSLKSQVEDIEYSLCAALLDSTNRLCHLVTSNKVFGERVTNALHDGNGLPNLTCDEMNLLDPNTTMVQAREFYVKMKPRYCNAICLGIDEKDSSVREPVCRSIQFAHQQIRVAIDLQKSLNGQDHGEDKSRRPPLANSQNGNDSKSPAAVAPQTSADSKSPQKLIRQGNPEESLTAQISFSQPRSDSLKSTVSSQPAAGPVTSKAALNHTKPTDLPSSQTNVRQTAPPVPQPVPEKSEMPGLSEISKEPMGQNKGQSDINGMLDAQVDVLGNSPAEIQSEGLVDPQNDPLADPPSDPQANAQVDAQTDAQGEAPAEVLNETQGEPQLPPNTDDDDGEDDNMRPFEGEDEIGPKVQDTNRDFVEKSPTVNKKSPESKAQLPLTQQNTSQGQMTGGLGNFEEAEDSHFFAYFMTLSALCILGYLVYHNKRKIIAMAVEGKKGRNTGRRRPNSASYHKLDSNLEEAMSSNLGSTNSYVIY